MPSRGTRRPSWWTFGCAVLRGSGRTLRTSANTGPSRTRCAKWRRSGTWNPRPCRRCCGSSSGGKRNKKIFCPPYTNPPPIRYNTYM
ncbi:MAG: hypothetical protein ACK55Z_17640, partial [bacterium]